MKTLQKQTSLFTEEQLTSSQVVSLANRTQSLDNEKVKKTNAIYGPKCLEQYGRLPHVTLWAKMFVDCLVGTGAWYSTRCVLSWKLLGIRSRPVLYLRSVSTPPTNGSEFGLLPTPSVADTEGSPKRPETITQNESGGWTRTSDNTGTKFGAKLNDVAGLLPTPAARDYKGDRTLTDGKNITAKGQEIGIQLEQMARIMVGQQNQPSRTSQLNPRFVLEMMGFPPDWTELPFLSGETNQ